MLDGLSALFAVAGFYLATLLLLWHGVKAIFNNNVLKDNKDHACFFLFLCFLAWAISTGLRSLILVWGYFGDHSLLYRYCSNGAAGLVLLVIGWPVLKQFRKINYSFDHSKFDNKESIVLILIGLILALYCYRVTLPWTDHDETAVYGYVSKLISGGRTFPDMIKENVSMSFVRSQLVQCWDAQMYGLANDTYLIRFNRLVNLLFCGTGLFTFLRLVRVGRFWSLVGVAAFLSTPELSYLALSLKVDPVVMMFEWGALMSMMMATVCYWMGQNSKQMLRTSFFLSVAALLLSAFSFGSRFSGIIPMLLSSGFSLFFLIKLTKRPLISFLAIFILFSLFMFISAPGYWEDYLLYKNPMYPVKPFWPWGNGAYVYTTEYFKSRWNIAGLPPVILQVYLIFALCSGLEMLAKVMPFLYHLPMAARHAGSMGWPYPFILGVFLWPFFIRGNRVINLIAGMFIFQFVAWSLGFHYSRLFVASYSLMILAVVMMADQALPPEDKVRKSVQQILKALAMAGLIVSFLLQAWWFVKKYSGPFLISPQQRYQANVKFLKEDYLEKNILTFPEGQTLNSFFLQNNPNPLVYTTTYSSIVLHVLFDRRIHIKDLDISSPIMEPGSYLLINPAYLKSKSIDKRILLRHIPVHVLTTPQTKWEVYAVK